jgi:hypothetical protein
MKRCSCMGCPGHVGECHTVGALVSKKDLCAPCRKALRGVAVRSQAAAVLGAAGGAAGRGESKRRDVDYAALGRKGGKAGKGVPRPK